MTLPRLRFSLRTLLLATLLAGSGMNCWRVREAWGFQKIPMYRGHRDELSEFTALFSQSGRFLAIRPGKLCADPHNGSDVLDLNEGGPIYPLPEEKVKSDRSFVAWHPTDDILLIKDTLKRYPGDQAVYQGGRMRFSDTGRYLIERKKGETSIRESTNFKAVLTIVESADAVTVDELLSADEKYWVRLRRRIAPAGRAGDGRYCISCFDIGASKQCWEWEVPDECDTCTLSHESIVQDGERFRGDGECFFTACSVSKNLIWDRDVVCYTMDYQSGVPKSWAWRFKGSVKAKEPPLDPSFFQDKEWRIAASGNRQGLVCDVLMPLAAPGMFTLTAEGSTMTMPIAVSGNRQRVAACVDGNALGIWTRRRQHLEWWGVYEQWEFWPVAAFFSAFVWSLWRDWKDSRKITLAPRALSA